DGGTPLSHAPYRTAFGLPHNVQFRSRPNDPVGFGGPADEAEYKGMNRRASPVLIHVARVGLGDYVPVVLWLKSPLTVDGQVRCSHGASPLPPPEWLAVIDFLRGL